MSGASYLPDMTLRSAEESSLRGAPHVAARTMQTLSEHCEVFVVRSRSRL
jgi:hypothetical protein